MVVDLGNGKVTQVMPPLDARLDEAGLASSVVIRALALLDQRDAWPIHVMDEPVLTSLVEPSLAELTIAVDFASEQYIAGSVGAEHVVGVWLAAVDAAEGRFGPHR